MEQPGCGSRGEVRKAGLHAPSCNECLLCTTNAAFSLGKFSLSSLQVGKWVYLHGLWRCRPLRLVLCVAVWLQAKVRACVLGLRSRLNTCLSVTHSTDNAILVNLYLTLPWLMICAGVGGPVICTLGSSICRCSVRWQWQVFVVLVNDMKTFSVELQSKVEKTTFNTEFYHLWCKSSQLRISWCC